MKRVVIFGTADNSQEYSRNYVIRKAFGNIGCMLIPCTVHYGFARSYAGPIFKMIYALIHAPFRWICLIFQYLLLPPHDLIFVPYPSHLDAWAGCILAKLGRRKIIVDAFFGLYDTIIRDRRLLNPKGFGAKLIWKYESLLLRSANLVLVDTEAQARMIQREFKLPEGRVIDVPVGINESLWGPIPFPEENVFRVIFWATFIPLHGVEIVAQAAKLLERDSPEIRFLVIGNGQLGEMFRRILSTLALGNLTWIDHFIPLPDIRKYVEESHCCLGIFSKQEKAQRVIPYKAYQALASARPLVTARTRAAEALFSEGVNAILVDPGDPAALAQAIRQLAKDRTLAAEIGKNGRKLYESELSNQKIQGKLERVLQYIDQGSP